MKENEETRSVKVILVGDTGVGKTCIIYRYIHDVFNDNTFSTITASYEQKTITLNENKIQFEIWDTCGQEKYRDIANIFFKDAGAAILVYDSTSRNSFNEMKEYWYNKVKENSPEDISMYYILIIYFFI